jgi:2-oxoisovalerate dehydrogenase E2 component (dihydrolipoyl transacylase)
MLTPGSGSLRRLHHVPRRHSPARSPPFRRNFQTSTWRPAIRTQKLGDVGEGITECMLNMWFVEEGARVEEWDKLCEMQSDKAAVEISVTYTGVIKKLYAQANDMVKTGAPIADIDDGLPEEELPATEIHEKSQEEGKSSLAVDEHDDQSKPAGQAAEESKMQLAEPVAADTGEEKLKWGSSLATPAIRGLVKEHNIDITRVNGSGKDGRVLKEDVQTYLENRNGTSRPPQPVRSAPSIDARQVETVEPLSPVQAKMFRAMTASLAIPHFLYTDEVEVTGLSAFRRRLNQSRETLDPKITLLPFILKAVSMSLSRYPLLNAHIDTTSNPSRPQLIYRRNHNIGIAMDTPAGLLVPVVKNVNALSINEIAQEILRLSELGKAKKLSSADLSGGTITISNIGNIGGTVVAPVIVEGQVGILGVGKSRAVPVFGENDLVVKAEVANFSWSADHRVVDGATMARMGSLVKKFIEEPEKLLVQMR